MTRRAIILVESGFQDEEFIYPYYRLQEAGFSLSVAGSTVCPVAGKHGIVARPDMVFNGLLSWLSASKNQLRDVIVIPGGWECPERLRQNSLVIDFLRAACGGCFMPVGAICHGPWVLASAGLCRRLDGTPRVMTCYKGMRDDLVNAGAMYTDLAVAVDGHFVTAQHYRDNPAFVSALINVSNAQYVGSDVTPC